MNIFSANDAALDEARAMEYLQQALPAADRLMLNDEALTALIHQVLLVRAQTPWGPTIPERVFLPYVLFPRVNNEDLQPCAQALWPMLRERVAGLTMAQAALAVNVWCCEQATYQSTDDRTLNALAVLRRGYGRCGEESTLLVSALRAVGIPARQIYVPRWAHCDDNHAWVEAWIDGEWHYLGACEPEPVLDSGWFTAAASKAMLVHTYAYGMTPEGERVEKTEGNLYTINRTAAYAATARLTVHVSRAGQHCAGVNVRFELANYGEFFPIIIKQTDTAGCVTLETGLGDLRLHAEDGTRFLCCMLTVRGDTACELDFDQAATEMTQPEQFAQHPPRETRIQPMAYPAQVQAAHNACLNRCEQLRAQKQAAFRTENTYLARACGNHAQLAAFLALPQLDAADKEALLNTLQDKDFVDVTAEVLSDALECALPFKSCYDAQVWQTAVLAPRILNEMLYPVRRAIRAWIGSDVPADAPALWAVLRARIAAVPKVGPQLIPDLRAVLANGQCPEDAFDHLFVACCRALGMAARLNPVTAAPEYWAEGRFCALHPTAQTDTVLVLHCEDRELHYGPDFTVAVLEHGAYRTLSMPGTVLKDRLEVSLPAGSYRVMTCTRQIDGGIDGTLTPVHLAAGESAEVQLVMMPERTGDMLRHVMLPALRAHTLTGTLIDITADLTTDAITALVAPGQEPTEHFFNELLEARDLLTARHIALRLVLRAPEEQANEKLQLVLRSLPDVQAYVGAVPDDELAWRMAMEAGDLRLPFATALNTQGEGLFSFVNYNVGSVQSLLRVLAAE